MGRKILAAGLMVLVAVVLVLPLALLGSSLADNVTALLQLMTHLLNKGPPSQPAWVTDVPVVGSDLHDRWQALADSGVKLTEALMKTLMPLRNWALRSAANLGAGHPGST